MHTTWNWIIFLCPNTMYTVYTSTYTYILSGKFYAGRVMLWDLCIWQLGHSSRSPCGTAYKHEINFKLPRYIFTLCYMTGFHQTYAHKTVRRTVCEIFILPMRCRVIEGWVSGSLKVNDSWPSALTTFLLVIVAREGCQQRGAAGCRGHTLVLQGRWCPCWTYPGHGCRGCTHLVALVWKTQSQKLCHRFKFHLQIKQHRSYFSVYKDKHKAEGHILKHVCVLHQTFYNKDDMTILSLIY